MGTITFNDNGDMVYNVNRNDAEDMLSVAFLAGKRVEATYSGNNKAYYIYTRGETEVDFIIVVV